MVSTSISNETKILNVNVDSKDPETANELAQVVSEKSVVYIAEIIEGSSMKTIDYPELSKGVYSPSYIRISLLGALAVFLIVLLIICIKQFLNDKIQSENELAERYDLPIVGLIPDLIDADKNRGNYYSYHSYYKHDHEDEEKGSEQGKYDIN